jgi:hypothetical protein
MQSLVPDEVGTPEHISDELVRAAMDRVAIPEAARAGLLRSVRRDLWLGISSQFGAELETSVHSPTRVILLGGSDDPLMTIDKTVPSLVNGTPPEEIWQLPGGHLFIADPRSRPALQERLQSLAARLAS